MHKLDNTCSNENIKSPSKPTCIKRCVTQYLLETTNLNPTVSTIVSPFLLSEGLKSSKLMTYNFGAHSCPGRDMSSLEARVAWVKNQPQGGFGEWSDRKIFQTSIFCFHVNFRGLYGVTNKKRVDEGTVFVNVHVCPAEMLAFHIYVSTQFSLHTKNLLHREEGDNFGLFSPNLCFNMRI